MVLLQLMLVSQTGISCVGSGHFEPLATSAKNLCHSIISMQICCAITSHLWQLNNVSWLDDQLTCTNYKFRFGLDNHCIVNATSRHIYLLFSPHTWTQKEVRKLLNVTTYSSSDLYFLNKNRKRWTAPNTSTGLPAARHILVLHCSTFIINQALLTFHCGIQ